MPDDPQAPLVSIGEFARRTHLTPKAIRLYDRVGLLPPASVDESSGYRRYGLDQVHTGRLIGLLRGADLSLAEIGLLLDDLATGGDMAAVERLNQLLGQIERRHEDRKLLIRHVQAILKQGDDPMFPIETRRVPSRRVMSIQRRLRASETDGFVREAKAAFMAHLNGAAAPGPFTLVFHSIVDYEHDGLLEVLLACPEDVQPNEVIGIRTEPAHDEAYTTITKAQWAYPAILAAYDSVACSVPVRARPGSRLSCREVYRAEPDAIGKDELICDVAFPLADR